MAPPTISDEATAAGQRSRSRRAPTKSRRPDEPVAEDPRAAARSRPYPEPKSHKASSAKKNTKGPNERKASSAKGKKSQARAQESEEEDAEGEDTGIEDEEQGGEVDSAHIRMGPAAAQPAPVAPRSYYPPSAHPQNYEIRDSPPAQKMEETQAQPQYQPYHEEPPRPNRPTGSLSSLADGPEGPEGRPPYPYSTLIRYAIEGSERGKLTLSELYTHIEARFPWFSKNGAGWKNSIRHNLSLNKSFVKIPRPLTEPGKGSYWCINYNAADGENAGDGAGTEPAKRKRKKKEEGPARVHQVADGASTDSAIPPPAPSVYENPYPTSGYNGQPVPQGYGYPPQQSYPSPHLQQQHTGAEGQEEDEYEGEEAAGEQEAPAPYQDPNAAYYAPQQYGYSHPAAQQHPAPPMQHPAPVEGVYPNASSPQTGYYPQHPAVPYPQQYPVQISPTQVPPQPPPQVGFVDDRPDRTAPRTIYNHAGGPTGGSYGSAAPATTPLGALATSVPHVNMNPTHAHPYGVQYAYGQYPPQPHVSHSQSPHGYTSSLGGAMGPPPGQI
ncbi:hypothetical protein FRC04_000339 [Tulasnella sp. 424]|nr:hypothetical protein FRC04_000339 [Tulasnella sp. 424]KAG8982199.1 hypothetical protein FRC05_000341 [Tulasnella sp. 425]